MICSEGVLVLGSTHGVDGSIATVLLAGLLQ